LVLRISRWGWRRVTRSLAITWFCGLLRRRRSGGFAAVKGRSLENKLDIVGVFPPFGKNLQRMFLRSQKSFVVSPALDESEPPRLSSGVSECIHNILASCLFCNTTDNSLDALHPHLELHVQQKCYSRLLLLLLIC